jgi:hypothetical protein
VIRQLRKIYLFLVLVLTSPALADSVSPDAALHAFLDLNYAIYLDNKSPLCPKPDKHPSLIRV